MVMQMLPRTFRGRLVLLFGLVWLAAGVPTYWLVSRVHSAQLVADRRDNLQGEARAAAALIASNLAERRREIALLAQTPLFRRAALNSPEIRASLERLQRSYPDYSWIGVADTTASVQQATGGLLVGADVAARPWFARGRQGDYVSDVHDAVLLARLLQPDPAGSPLRFVDFASPVRDDEGRLRGVLASHAHWRWAGEVLRSAMAEASVRAGVEVLIVNSAGRVLYPETADARLRGAGPHHAVPVNGFARWDDGREWLTVSAVVHDPVPDTPLGWRIVLRQPRDIVLANVRELQVIILGLTGIGAALFLVLAWLGADRMSQPLEDLAAVARRLQRGEEDIDFATDSGSREMQRLALALSGMAATLLERKHALEAMNRELESKVEQRTQELVYLNTELVQLNVNLERLAREDALTGLPNRRATTERLAQEWAECRRGKAPFAVLMLDIDHFKRINDSWGHATGDEVLRQVAGVLRQGLRQTDVGGRVGGEEFMVLLPMTNLQQAVGVAEKLRALVASTPVPPVGAVTISIGVATVHGDDADEDDVVRRADACLYQAKAGGRNRVASSLQA